VETVILFLGKLDEVKYKKDKLSLESIKGGIKGEYTKEKEQVRQMFIEQLSHILDVLDSQRAKAPSSTWASLFYHKGQGCQDVTPLSKITHYQYLLKNYLRILRKRETKDGQNATTSAKIKVAENFMDFLQSHTTDPDSCLIGLACSEEAHKNVRRHVDVDPSFAYATAPTPHGSIPSPPNFQQLCTMVVDWGVGEDDTWMKEQIQKQCATLRGVDKLEKGDLAIIGTISASPDSEGREGGRVMVFARHTGMKKNNNSHLEFFVNSEENKREWISFSPPPSPPQSLLPFLCLFLLPSFPLSPVILISSFE
jgi:hypothetical protein